MRAKPPRTSGPFSPVAAENGHLRSVEVASATASVAQQRLSSTCDHQAHLVIDCACFASSHASTGLPPRVAMVKLRTRSARRDCRWRNPPDKRRYR